MIDTNRLMRAWLTATNSPVVTALGGQNRVFTPVLPEKVKLTSGPAVVIAAEGGVGHSEILGLQKVRVQISAWADKNKNLLARQIYRSVYEWIHGKQNIDFGDFGRMLTCLATDIGQDVIDPDTGEVQVVGFFEVMVIDVNAPNTQFPVIELADVIDGDDV